MIGLMCFQFCPKKYLFISCFFYYLNPEELIQQVYLRKYIENETLNSKEDEQKYNPTSLSSFLKLLKNDH